jgi:hypothetical protein
MDTERVDVGDVEYHTRVVHLYRCANCANEENKKCTVKPDKKDIKLNKKRNHCKQFELDDEKFERNKRRCRPIPIERRPDWYWLNRRERKRLAELLQGAAVVPPAAGMPPAARPQEEESSIIAPPYSDKLIWTPEDDEEDYGT